MGADPLHGMGSALRVLTLDIYFIVGIETNISSSKSFSVLTFFYFVDNFELKLGLAVHVVKVNSIKMVVTLAMSDSIFVALLVYNVNRAFLTDSL